MNTSFGAFVRHRRHTLGLTRDQLAHRLSTAKKKLDVDHLENGEAGQLDRDDLVLLAGALEWRVGMLIVASRILAHDPSSADDPARITYLHAEDEVDMIEEELVSLRDLRDALQEWKGELIIRMESITSHLRSEDDGHTDR